MTVSQQEQEEAREKARELAAKELESNEPAEGKKPEEEEKEKETKSSTREYVLLKQGAGKDVWGVVGSAVASSAESAVRSLGEEKLENGSVYVAVPQRNWNPITVAVEKTTSIKLDSK